MRNIETTPDTLIACGCQSRNSAVTAPRQSLPYSCCRSIRKRDIPRCNLVLIVATGTDCRSAIWVGVNPSYQRNNIALR